MGNGWEAMAEPNDITAVRIEHRRGRVFKRRPLLFYGGRCSWVGAVGPRILCRPGLLCRAGALLFYGAVGMLRRESGALLALLIVPGSIGEGRPHRLFYTIHAPVQN